MADWVLIPCLVALRTEINFIAPYRDKASDGSIGDTAHQQETSDHNPDETGSVPIHDADHINEVHAIDVDNDLRESDLTMEKIVQFLLGRCRSGAERRLRYIIWNKRIWSASSDWVQKTYTGPSPHTEHAHFSASYETALEASTASWHLEDIPVALTQGDKDWIADQIADRIVAAIPRIVVAIKEGIVQPTADAVAVALEDDFKAIPSTNFTYARQQVKPPMSDTAVNLITSTITQADVAGVAVVPFDTNKTAVAAAVPGYVPAAVKK